jgi:hypothetical protein
LFSSIHLLSHNGAGTFPWQASAFGDSTNDAPIDYSILQLNWTADPLQCVLLNQVITLHLDSQSSTAYVFPPHKALSTRAPLTAITLRSACYACGPNLRMICTTLDSERTNLPNVDSYAPIASECASFASIYRGLY